MVTQPLMYKIIENHPSVRRLYLDRLVTQGEITPEEIQALSEAFHGLMEQAFGETRDSQPAPPPPRSIEVSVREPVTAVGRDELDTILSYLTSPPDGFVIHPKLQKLVDDRRSGAPGAGLQPFAS